MPILDAVISALRPIPFRKFRLLNPLVAATGTRRAKVFGAWMNLDLSDVMQRQIYLGCYEPACTRWTKRLLRRNDVMLDIGANVGYFTALGAACVGNGGRVLAFEPNPLAFDKLQQMVAKSGLRMCEIVQVGLSGRDGEMTLWRQNATEHNLNASMVPLSNGSPITVPVRTLDELADERNVGRVDLMKIDVEGHEPQVLAGAARLLRQRRVRAILIEFNDYFLRESGSSPSDLWKSLTSAGFECVNHVGGGLPPFPHGCCDTHLFALT